MKFSTRARYALRMLVIVAREATEDRPVSLAHVATTTHLSRRYLEQLVIALRKANVLRGVSGRAGGYVLARAASKITLCEVVEAAIGPINVVHCVRRPELCIQSEFCECRSVYLAINHGIRQVLGKLTVQDLSNRDAHRALCHSLPLEASGCPKGQAGLPEPSPKARGRRTAPPPAEPRTDAVSVLGRGARDAAKSARRRGASILPTPR
jgi:Rrf2 family protein